jgi:hypothetical protein
MNLNNLPEGSFYKIDIKTDKEKSRINKSLKNMIN